MKIIKSAKKFKIKNISEMANPKTALITAFFESLGEIGESDSLDGFEISYSYLSSSYDRNLHRSPDQDFKKILLELDEQGWDKEELKNLFDRHGDQIAEMYNNDNVPGVQLSGMVDYFLFKMTKGKVLLMGYNTQDFGGAGEAFLKFSYGYNKTPYGKLAMMQHFDSLDGYYDFLGEHFVDLLSIEGAQDVGESIYEPLEFMKMIEEHYDMDNITQFYSYDKATKTGTLDLASAGINLGDNKILRPEKRYGGSSIVHEAADIKQMLAEFLNSVGVDLPDINVGRGKILEGGKSVIQDGIVKIYFDVPPIGNY